MREKLSPAIEEKSLAALNRLVDDLIALNIALHQNDVARPTVEIASVICGAINILAKEIDPQLPLWIRIALDRTMKKPA